MVDAVTTNAAAGRVTGGTKALASNFETFLTLLTTQMKNQDPFNPVDNTQMVAQMAQFSSLAGITGSASGGMSIALAAMYTANHFPGVKAIIALTESGYTPLIMSRIRSSWAGSAYACRKQTPSPDMAYL